VFPRRGKRLEGWQKYCLERISIKGKFARAKSGVGGGMNKTRTGLNQIKKPVKN